MKEETGLDFVPLKADEMFCKPLFSSIGMTDESVATVYGCSTGQVSREGLEDNEEIEVVLADRAEVRRTDTEGGKTFHQLCLSADAFSASHRGRSVLFSS